MVCFYAGTAEEQFFFIRIYLCDLCPIFCLFFRLYSFRVLKSFLKLSIYLLIIPLSGESDLDHVVFNAIDNSEFTNIDSFIISRAD